MDIISILFKLFYWPICRAYSRCLGNRQADSLMAWLCSFQFYRVHHFWPDFIRPTRFSEKLWHRMLYERNPIYTLISDKLQVRDYVAKKVKREYLIPILWSGEKPEEIPFDKLPLEFVIKTNHGAGYVIIVKDKKQLDQMRARRQLNKWLKENFGQDKYLGISWGYRNIKPHIIIESFLEENGTVPVDYKFWCFWGRVESISLYFDRFEDRATMSFNREFEPGGFKRNLPLYSGEYQRPSNYKEMVRVAESLAEGFDFMRVDLYNVDNKIYFSELTPYPGGVFAKFEPESVDYALGEKWKSKKV